MVVLAEATLPAVQALIRWDPVTFSERELAERAELGFPPAVRMASVTGPAEAVADFVGAAGAARPGRGARAGSGRARAGGGFRGNAGARADQDPAARRPGAGRALHAAQAIRSARKDGGAVRVRLDPAEVA